MLAYSAACRCSWAAGLLCAGELSWRAADVLRPWPLLACCCWCPVRCHVLAGWQAKAKYNQQIQKWKQKQEELMPHEDDGDGPMSLEQLEVSSSHAHTHTRKHARTHSDGRSLQESMLYARAPMPLHAHLLTC
jgi:hypothetical protein